MLLSTSLSSLNDNIQNLLVALESANKLKQDAQKLGDKECIELADQIQVKLNATYAIYEDMLPTYAIDKAVQWAAGELGISIAHMFPTHLESMLAHTDEGIRQVAVRCGELTEAQLNAACEDPKEWVKGAAKLRAKNVNKLIIGETNPISLEAYIRVTRR